MGLTDDQKAMLRLLAQREEGYDDMAALMGISVEEVRERVKEALAEVEEPAAGGESAAEEEPAPPGPDAVDAPEPKIVDAPKSEPAPTPGAEPKPQSESQPAEAAEPRPEPEAVASTAPSSEPSPAEKPSVPREPAAEKPAPSKRSVPLPSLSLPKDRGALIGLGAGVLVVLALVIVLALGGSGDDSSSGSGSAASNEGSVAEGISATAKDKSLTQAVLAAEDGSDATGQAIFGRLEKKVVLQVTGEGLEPSADGESYAVWLSHTGNAMVPVGTTKVEDSGQLAARFEVPPAVLVLVARGAFDEVNVTRTVDSRLSAAIARARKSEAESTYKGTPVMKGKITGPLVGAGGTGK
ncbi:MAG TPA: hypothetical protein VG898_09625 [Solirubrobacterales bacterium]|nr:hypothetical protein [Solirubrobacterales bacterium]